MTSGQDPATTATINQALDGTGTDNEARIGQAGGPNTATVTQDGDLNKAYTSQTGSGGSLTVDQSGNNNEAGNATLALLQSGTGNSGDIDQTGDGNIVRLNQSGDQSGVLLGADIDQDGGETADVTQAAANVTAIVNQLGTGSGNIATVDQSFNALAEATVNQFGTGGEATINQ
jgi:hypothetical protein